MGPDSISRFDLREERFVHGGFSVQILLPRAADELIDEREFDRDERLPYWAVLWPAASALARVLLDEEPPVGRVIELGCGLALPSLALRSRGADVLATDYYPEALEFARTNAERNGIPPPETALLDWREEPRGFGRFGLILAADVLYERRNAQALARLLPRLARGDARILLADPGRVHRSDFDTLMDEVGWRAESDRIISEPSPAPDDGAVSAIRVTSFRRAELVRS